MRLQHMRLSLPGFVAAALAVAAVALGVWWVQKQAYRPESLAWQFIERDVRTHYPDVPTISTDRLGAWLADDARRAPVLLDAREPDEYAVSHLPGAVRVDPDAGVDALLTSVLRDAAGRPVVVYCSVGLRSGSVAQRLTRAGVGEVYNLEGSIFRWANERRPLVRGAEAVREVHPYNLTWGRLVRPAYRADVD